MDSGLVFTASSGRPLEPRNVLTTYGRLLDRVELPRIRFHDLRHTCATLLLSRGVSPRVVMDILGHSQIAVTMNIYAHVMPTMQDQAAGEMDAALGDDASPDATPDTDGDDDAQEQPEDLPGLTALLSRLLSGRSISGRAGLPSGFPACSWVVRSAGFEPATRGLQ